MLFQYLPKNYFILFFFVILTSCAVTLSLPRISQLYEVEQRKMLSKYNLKNDENKELNKILTSVLKELSLSEDFAKIIVFNEEAPVIFAGVSQEIYISEGAIYNIPRTDIRLFFIHELFHKKLNHPYKTLSNLSIGLGFQHPRNASEGMLYALMFTGLHKKDSVKELTPDNYGGASNHDQNDNYVFQTKIIDQPIKGYLYPDEIEWTVDDKVLDFMREKGEDTFLYIRALERLSKMITDKLGKQDKKLIHRIKRLKEIEQGSLK